MRFGDLPIRRQLAAAIGLTMCVGLLMAGAGLGSLQAWSDQRALAARIATAADVTARNSTAALVFEDESTARDLLAGLAQEPSVVAAATYDAHRRIVATYSRAHATVPATPGQPRTSFEKDGLTVVRAVVVHDETVGWVLVNASTAELVRARAATALVVGSVLLVAAVVSWLLVRPLLRRIAQPVVDLAASAQQVSSRRDFSVRVTRSAGGDVGVLVDRFNDMLAELARQDGELRQHADALEGIVAARTAELTRANHDLLVARDRAEEASRAKSQFVANMSHELRTPMNGILGMTEIALELPLAPEQRECLQTIRTSATGLLQVINDVLDFSRLNVGSVQVSARPFVLETLVDSVVALVAVQASRKGLRLVTSVGPEVPPALVGDVGRIRQVLTNLLGNAVKFTDHGEVALRVSRRSGTTPATFAFEVSDTGPGIAAEHLTHLFEPFWQADGSLTRRHEGTGLGLSIARNLAELLGGTLHVTSELGRGSTFSLIVPLEASAGTVPAGHSAPATTGPDHRRFRVLVAEDNRVNQIVARRLLQKHGHGVSMASNGTEVLAWLASERFDIVLMDVQMPEMDGLEATRRIRQHEASAGGHLPIVAVTAHALPADRARCLDAGMDGYIAKPFTADALEAELRRAVDAVARLKGEAA